MSAVISECGQYRYQLDRQSHELTHNDRSILFIMLNPSTADASINDPTITRCLGFMRSFEYGMLTVANLYALRATKPKALWEHHDPIGPDNDATLRRLANEHMDAICAWGANAQPERVAAVVKILRKEWVRLWCLGINKNGSPKHPLYVPAAQELIKWS